MVVVVVVVVGVVVVVVVTGRSSRSSSSSSDTRTLNRLRIPLVASDLAASELFVPHWICWSCPGSHIGALTFRIGFPLMGSLSGSIVGLYNIGALIIRIVFWGFLIIVIV